MNDRSALTLPAAAQGVFDFMLALEIFESELYKAVLGTSGSAAQNALFTVVRAKLTAVPAARATVEQIALHEAGHVATLAALGAQNVFGLTAASFDFTGGRTTDGSGPLSKATTDLPSLLQVAQLVEDVGVRTWKGQLASLLGQPELIELALRIHSVEARHAARIRRLRRLAAAASELRLSGVVRGGGLAAGGLTDKGTTANAAAVEALFGLAYAAGASASAPAESNVVQLDVDVSAMAGAPFGVDAAQEAFDEPLGRADVIAVVQGFFIPTLV